MKDHQLRLEDVDSIEKLPKIEIDNKTEIILQAKIYEPGVEYAIFDEISISKDIFMKILKEIKYGEIGWEKYHIVERGEIRKPVE